MTQPGPTPFEASAPEQQDWYRPADELREYMRSLRASVARLTVKEVAFDLNLAPESLEHQLRRWDKRKQPSAKCAYVCLKRDTQHRTEVMGQFGLIVAPKPKLTTEQAVRAISERAVKGYVSAQEVAQILAQTSMGGDR